MQAGHFSLSTKKRGLGYVYMYLLCIYNIYTSNLLVIIWLKMYLYFFSLENILSKYQTPLRWWKIRGSVKASHFGEAISVAGLAFTTFTFADIPRRWGVTGLHTPWASMGLIYLPTFTTFHLKKQSNVGKYTIDGWYGIYENGAFNNYWISFFLWTWGLLFSSALVNRMLFSPWEPEVAWISCFFDSKAFWPEALDSIYIYIYKLPSLKLT